jgi:hypothetical protein
MGCFGDDDNYPKLVMPALVAGIHDFGLRLFKSYSLHEVIKVISGA